MTVLPTLPQNYIEKIGKLLESFLWGGKKPKISTAQLGCSYEDGGLNLVNLSTKEKALKISWVKNLQNDRFLSEMAYHKLNHKLREQIWYCNIKDADVEFLIPFGKTC